MKSEEKTRLKLLCKERVGFIPNGLAGLYAYFLLISHAWLADGGIGVWLIPSEFMDVNYGKVIKNYLLTKVSVLHIHRFNPLFVQFHDALTSSAVIWFKKQTPPPNHSVKFTFGNSLLFPEFKQTISIDTLKPDAKWSHFSAKTPINPRREHKVKLSDLFTIKRGIATGANKFFILNSTQIEKYQLPRRISTAYIAKSSLFKN